MRRWSLCILLGLALAAALSGPALAITPTITEFSNGITALGDPTSITVGPDGNLWFVEYQAGRIGKVTPQGAITEVATGGVTPGFSSNPHIAGIVPGADGQLWFTEGTDPGRIGRIDPSTGSVQEMATGGVTPGFTVNAGPEEIAAGPDGNVWFAELGNPAAAIARITPSGTVTEFMSGLTANGEPSSITPTAAADGNLWFTEIRNGANKIGRVAPGSGAITEFSTGLEASGDIRDIVPGPHGNVWFAQFASPGRIGKAASDGTITEAATGGVTPGFSPDMNPDGIAEGPDGAVWFTEFHQPSGQGKVGRLDPATGSVEEFATPTEVSAPYQIVQGPDGNMWFAEFAGHRIARITTPPIAATTGAGDVKARSATIAGTANGHAQATSFHVDYGPVGGALSSTPEQTLGVTSGATPVSATLGGLSPSTGYQARVVVTNPTGSSAGAFVDFTTPSAAPVISGARQSAKRWRVGRKLPRFSRRRHRPPVGTTFSLTVDQPAKLRFAFQKSHSCKKRHRHGKCRRLTAAGTLSFGGHAGLNKLRFQGRVSRHRRLKPGVYRLTITARNAAGQTSKPRHLRFSIVK